MQTPSLLSTTPSRYIPHSHVPPTDLKAVKHRIHEAFYENVVRVHRHPSSDPTVYVGSAGEIMMDMRAFAILPHKSFPSTPTSSLIAVPFHEPQHGGHVSFLETSVGPATLVLVRQLRLRQNPDSYAHKHARRGNLDAETLEEKELAETWRGAADLISAAQEVASSDKPDDDGCEVLYGRAGLLYALLLMRAELAITLSYLAHSVKSKDKVVREIGNLCSDQGIKALVDDIIKRGELGAQLYRDDLEESESAKAPPLMWRWHMSRYLGGAHGVAGILHVLLHAPSVIIQPHWSKLLACIEWLLAIQDPLGNWPSKAGRYMFHIPGAAAIHEESKHMGVDEAYDDALVQWCHGAPAFLMLFSALLRRSSASPSACPLSSELRTSVIAATNRAAELVYTRGLLRKGTGLCHGVAGNIYALLSVSDALDSVRFTESTRTHSKALALARSLSHHAVHPTLHLDPEHAYWLLRAVHLADLSISYPKLVQEGKMSTPDHPYSLYEGLAGMCCAWAEVLLRLAGGPDVENGDDDDTIANSSSGRNGGARGPGWRGGLPGFDDLALLE